MNERIRELAEQAGFEITPWGNELLPCVHQEGPIDVELNKFAELIVGECAKVIFETPVEYIETDTMHRIRDRVKQHFGVEL